MFKSEYDKIIRENFDLSDRYTRQYIATLKDAGQEQLLNTLSSAMYDNIVAKVDEIDFGTIPMSRGDITKVEGFEKTMQCLDIIRRLVMEYKQSTGVVDVVISAIQNVKDRKAIFIKSYVLNVELPMLVYNSIVMSIERSVSLLIATCIEYIKDPTSSSPKAALNKVAYQRTMDDVMFKQLITFNNTCANGSLDKVIDTVLKNPVKEDVEMQFGTMTTISEEEPTSNADDVIKDIVQDSPVAPNNTVDPFSDPNAAVAPGAVVDPAEVESPADGAGSDETDGLTGDMDIPAPNEFPEDVPAEAPDVASNDNVDPDNIPAVVPGDDVTDSNSAINEKELHEKVNPIKVGLGIAAAGALLLGGKKFIGTLANTVVNLIRNCVYGVYYSRLKFADFLEVQADLIEANANDLRYSTTTTLSDEERGKTLKKQYKVVEKLRKWANVFAIDSKKTSNEVNKAVSSEDKKKKTIGRNEYNDDIILF